MREYALNDRGDLIKGDKLEFAYSGSGVATLTDEAGTGFKVAVGTHNLAGIGAKGLILASDEESAPEKIEKPLKNMNHAELDTVLADAGIALDSDLTKAQKVAQIGAARVAKK
jgi:hypothetical protein